MFVKRIACPVDSLGPGRRAVVWTVGCTKCCAGCANPDLWEADSSIPNYSVANLAELLGRLNVHQGIHRLTLTGGDPLEQVRDTVDLLKTVRPYFDDILVYTGFTLDEVQSRLTEDEFRMLATCADVLVEGPYIDALNDGTSALRGSTNQIIHFFNADSKKEYCAYLAEGRKVSNLLYSGQLLSVGIHKRDPYGTSMEGDSRE